LDEARKARGGCALSANPHCIYLPAPANATAAECVYMGTGECSICNEQGQSLKDIKDAMSEGSARGKECG